MDEVQQSEHVFVYANSIIKGGGDEDSNSESIKARVAINNGSPIGASINRFWVNIRKSVFAMLSASVKGSVDKIKMSSLKIIPFW